MTDSAEVQTNTLNNRRSSVHPLAQDIREAEISAFPETNEEETDAFDVDRAVEPTSNGYSCAPRFSERLSSTNFTMRSSSLQSQFSQASSGLMSFSAVDLPPSSQFSAPTGPVSIEHLKLAIADLVTGLMPSDIDVYKIMLDVIPDFVHRYRENLRQKLKSNLDRMAADCTEELLNSKDTAKMEAVLRELDIYKRDPDKMKELREIPRKTPESRMMDPRVGLAKRVGKAIRYSDREMQRLKKEEEDLQKLVKEKTALLHTLMLRSENLVTRAEQVAKMGRAELPTDLPVQQATLATIIQQHDCKPINHAVYSALPSKTLNETQNKNQDRQ